MFKRIVKKSLLAFGRWQGVCLQTTVAKRQTLTEKPAIEFRLSSHIFRMKLQKELKARCKSVEKVFEDRVC